MNTKLAPSLIATALFLALPWHSAAAAGAAKDIRLGTNVETLPGHGLEMAVDPADSQRLTIGLSGPDTRCRGKTAQGAYVSSDRGRTWKLGCFQQAKGYIGGYSPTVSYNADGELLALDSEQSTTDGNYVPLLRRSTDGGQTWALEGVAFPLVYPTMSELHLRLDAGKVSPYRGRLYSTALDVAVGSFSSVRVATSLDGGHTWSAVQATPRYDQLQGEFASAPDLAVGRNGSLYMSYVRCLGLLDASCTLDTVDVVLVSSTDGGSTWSAPRPIQQMTPTKVGNNWQLPNTTRPLQFRPVLAVDASSGAHGGRLYSVVSSQTGGRLQILISHSDDGGSTWSAPAAVAPVVGHYDQFQPSLQVSAQGDVAVTWLDRRNDPGNLAYQPMLAVSTDGGASFGAPLMLYEHLTNPNGMNGFFDATGLAASVWSGRIVSTTFIAEGTGADLGVLTVRYSGARP